MRPLLHWRRRDARRNFYAVARVLLQYADWETLRARPGHTLIAEKTGVCTRTVARYIDALHQWGYLMTTELGTTPKIRAGRTFGHDPYEGNRAQEYRLCVPVWMTRAGLEDSTTPADGPHPEIVHEVASQNHNLRTVHPSRSARSAETGKHGASRLRHPEVTRARVHARARAACGHGRPAAGKPKTQTARRRQEWRSAAAAVAQVWRALPRELTERLADHEADRLANELARQLTHRTVAELTERITRHWEYWRYKLTADVVRSPIAMAHRMVRRDYDCTDIRCEDGWQLDHDAACKACALTVRERIGAQDAADGPSRGCPDHQPEQPDNNASSTHETHLPPPAAKVVTERHTANHAAAAERGAALARRLLRSNPRPGQRLYSVKEVGRC
ncbi:hypothetical protein [Actinomadura sp. WAC 06369]|uniref:hypothetical protein n=1 Tax=Actinomadura sp. WAC 06369 TaxID=2203193 RepID=UPI000F766FDA|nr:hypothetical protein [Actinomadura sp. WAC 06369]RSN48276.1 hypothetical protein DMH08_34440 [Actinomadura sp. WAC 06369]